MVNKILVPIAFSKYSHGILKYASGLAEAFGAELLVVNVVNERDIEAVERISSYGYKVDSEHYIDIIQEEREKELAGLFQELTLPDEKVSFKFRVGEPTYELLKLVVREQVDMVVMGMKTRDIKHIFAGSVAERMFRRCPATIVSYREDDIAARLEKRARKYIDRHG